MHFDRQLLYLALVFGAESVCGLAIDRPRPGEQLSVSSPDPTYTTHDATMGRASKMESFEESASPSTSLDMPLPPGADTRIAASASRTVQPSSSHDAAPNSFSSLSPSDIPQIFGSAVSLVPTSTMSPSIVPAASASAHAHVNSHLELRQTSGEAPCSTDGELVCNGPKEFGICSWGRVTFEPVADGTSCVNGEIAFDNVSSSAAPSGSISQSSATPSQSSQSVSHSIGVASRSSTPSSQSSQISHSSTPLSISSSILPSSISSSQSSAIKSGSSTSTTSLTGIRTRPTHSEPTSHPTTTTIHTTSHLTSTSNTLNPTNFPGNATAQDSTGTHPISNASVAGIVGGLAASVVLLGLAGLYLHRRRQQGKPLFGARGSKRSTGSYYPKSAWLYDPQISTPGHSRAPSDAGQNLIPDPRPDTVEMEAGIPGSPDMRPGRSSSPLLPPTISITRDDSPEGSPRGSPHRSGGRRSRPMMSINEDEE